MKAVLCVSSAEYTVGIFFFGHVLMLILTSVEHSCLSETDSVLEID